MKKIFLLLITILVFSNCEPSKIEQLHAQNQTIDSTLVLEPLEFHPEINKIGQILYQLQRILELKIIIITIIINKSTESYIYNINTFHKTTHHYYNIKNMDRPSKKCKRTGKDKN